ncbi:unnamed protein product, partial [marine sediment metagenome]
MTQENKNFSVISKQVSMINILEDTSFYEEKN